MTCSKRLKAAMLLATAAAVAVILYVKSPSSMTWMPTCPFYAFTGFYCPGCGSLRGLHQLMHGHVREAISFNPLLILLVPMLLFSIASAISVVCTGKHLRGLRTPGYTGWVVFGVVVAHMILRNIPIYPFTLLAPH